jgi:hypothetical protein
MMTWRTLIVVLIGLVVLVLLPGCSSAPKSSRLVADQYCYTSQTIETEDQSRVSSKTTVKCSDDPIEKYVPAKMGLAKDCYESHIPLNRNGRLIHEKIYVCQKLNGSYDIVEPVRVR